MASSSPSTREPRLHHDLLSFMKASTLTSLPSITQWSKDLVNLHYTNTIRQDRAKTVRNETRTQMDIMNFHSIKWQVHLRICIWFQRFKVYPESGYFQRFCFNALRYGICNTSHLSYFVSLCYIYLSSRFKFPRQNVRHGFWSKWVHWQFRLRR